MSAMPEQHKKRERTRPALSQDTLDGYRWAIDWASRVEGDDGARGIALKHRIESIDRKFPPDTRDQDVTMELAREWSDQENQILQAANELSPLRHFVFDLLVGRGHLPSVAMRSVFIYTVDPDEEVTTTSTAPQFALGRIAARPGGDSPRSVNRVPR